LIPFGGKYENDYSILHPAGCAHADHKDEAIQMAGQCWPTPATLIPATLTACFKREQVANTFLGGGVAIPHGMIEDRHLIHHTGIAILQVPNGVEWNEGQKAYLVVAIAAQSDEHIALLRRLTRLMQQPEALDTSVHAENPLVLLAALGDAAEPSRFPNPPHRLGHPTRKWNGPWTIPTVCTPVRPRAGSRPPSGFPVNCGFIGATNSPTPKALTGLLALGITNGSTLRLAARGADAQRALNALHDTVRRLSVEEKADAERARRNALAARKTAPDWTPRGAPARFTVSAPVPGWRSGRLVRYLSQRFEIADQPGDVVAEGEALEQAMLAVQAEREALEIRTRQRLSAAEAAIFAAQRELLADPVLVRDALATIMQGHSAAWSWQRALRARIDVLQKVADPLLAARALDLRDVGEQVLAQLLGIERRQMTLSEPSILVAEDLTPSDTLQLDTRSCGGAGHQSGRADLAYGDSRPHAGFTGPGCRRPALLAAPEGGIAVIDGGTGCLYLDVNEADQRSVAEVIARQAADREVYAPCGISRPRPPTAIRWKLPPTWPIPNRRRRRWKPARKALV
jgi:mannitol/fructose-specific phosphotransferase system IIA component